MLETKDVKAADYAPGEAIVVYEDDEVAQLQTHKLSINSSAATEIEQITTINSVTVAHAVSQDKTTKQLIAYMEKQPGVKYAEPNYYIHADSASSPSDPYYLSQWALMNVQQDGGISGADIGTFIPWYKGYSSTSNVIAVIDTGVDYTHEDLINNMWHNTTLLNGVYGYDYANNDSDPYDDSTDGHGTHASGIIAAQGDNGKGVTGVCQRAKIMALKSLDEKGEGTVSNAIKCYQYIYNAMQRGVKVVAVNNSWGCSGYSKSLNDIVEKVGALGAVSVFAAGNDGKYMSSSSLPVSPSNKYAITVAASDSSDRLASFSNYGSSTVDIAAPGQHILSTVNYNKFLPNIYNLKQLNTLCSQWSVFSAQGWANLFTTTSDYVNTTVSWDSTVNVPAYPNSRGALKIVASNPTGSKQNFGLYYNTQNTGSAYVTSFIYAVDDINQWYSNMFNATNYKTINGKSYIGICNFSVDPYATQTFYVDNWGLSQPSPNTSTFGKYDYMNGTSMAAPFVTGGVALLKARAPQFKADQIKQFLLKCVRKSSNLSGKVRTGGTLCLTNIESAYTSMVKTINAKKVVAVKKFTVKYYKKVKVGKKYKFKVTVKPKNATNKKVKFKVSNKKYASISSKGVFKAKKKGRGKKVKVTVWSVYNKKLKTSFYVRIRK